MITLITGGPGTGKTAWLLDQLLELRALEPDKLLYIHGIRNLRGIAHDPIYCRSQLCDICRGQDADIQKRTAAGEKPLFVEDWPDWKQPNSLIVVDEVQRIWRPTNGASSVHESISTLETHRHYGVDFWLISQGPHLFHNFIRLLVGRHVHLVAKWSGRMQYEWPECKQDVQSRSDAVIRPYKLPKRVYNLYDSAEVHTKQDKRKPLAFYALLVCFGLMGVMGYFIYGRVQARMHPDVVASPSAGAASAAPVVGSSGASVASAGYPDFTPVVAGVPESAPAYKELLKVKDVPLLVGCIQSKAKCTCYTHQGTIYPTTPQYCAETMKGNRFNPYFEKLPDTTALRSQEKSTENNS